MVPCLTEVDMNNSEITRQFKTECVFILYIKN